MYWPDTNSVADVEPARKPVASAVRKFFTEGGPGVQPTVPGGDWFNQVTNELLNILAAAGIDPSKADDDQLLQAINSLIDSGFIINLDEPLTPSASFDDVPSYEEGGPGGQMNEQAQALLNRTEALKDGLLGGGVARGNPSSNFALSGAAFRRYVPDSPDWGMVQDATHIPVNSYSIETGVDVTIHYKGSKIGSLVCGSDESFAKDGVIVGASVGPDNAIVSLGAPCSFIIDLDDPEAPVIFDDKFYDAVRFNVSIAPGGQVTISHPSRRLMQYPIVQHYSDNSLFEPLTVHYVASPSPGGFSCFLVGEAEGLISYSGSSWGISSSSWSTAEMTFSWDGATGVLTVTHPQVLGSPGINLTPLNNGATLNLSLSEVGATGFKVRFRRFDDTIPTLSSALGFYFSRGVSAIRKVPTGKLHVYLGHVQVNCNHVNYQFGNFWTLGLMRDDDPITL